MKKTFALILALSLILTALAACGKKPEETTTEADLARGAAALLPQTEALQIETELAGFEISCIEPADPDALKMDAKDVFAASGKYDDTDTPCSLLIRVREVKKTNEIFRILAQVGVSRALLSDTEGEVDLDAALIARRGGTWLFSVQTHPEEKSFFLYNPETRGFALLGIGVCELLGDTLLLGVPDYSDGEVAKPYDILDWSANRLQSGMECAHRLLGDKLYLIAEGRDANGLAERRLLTIPVDAAGRPERYSSVSVGDLGLYFDHDKDDALLLITDGGRQVKTTIAELPSLVGDNLKATGKVRETMGAYTVTLPDAWAGKYEVSTEDRSLYFRHKASGVTLFELFIEPMPEDIRAYMRGDGAYPICWCAAENTPANIMVSEQANLEDDAEYKQLRMALAGSSLYRLEEHIAPADGDHTVKQFDVVERLTGEYAGRGSISGHDYIFRIDGGHRVDLYATLIDQTTDDVSNGTYRMFWNQGMEYGDPYGGLGGTYLFDLQDGSLRLELDDDMIILKPSDGSYLPQPGDEKAEAAGNYTASCVVADSSYDEAVFDCTREEDWRDDRLLHFSATPNELSVEFDFYMRLQTVLEPIDGQYPANVVARRGNTWLVCVQTEPEERSSWLLVYQREHSHEVDGVWLLGRYDLCDWTDDTITLSDRDYSDGEIPVRKDVYSWSGGRIYSTP